MKYIITVFKGGAGNMDFSTFWQLQAIFQCKVGQKVARNYFFARGLKKDPLHPQNTFIINKQRK